MARRTFFSFHYERDIWRSCQVRNCWVTQPDRESAGFWDGSIWEDAKKEGDTALKRLINDGLNNTSVTAVLIGAETASRRWVRYEIAKSFEKGNGFLGIYIHNQKDKDGNTDTKGANPFASLYFRIDKDNKKIYLWEWANGKWVSYADVPSVPLGNVSYDFKGLTEGQLSSLFPTYDWVNNDGYNNCGDWIESAAKAAGR